MNIEHLYMSFGLQEIFNDVNIRFNDNDKVGVVGVNGAGKSTLFNLILGLASPDSGKITIKNKDLIGYLPQVITDEIPDDNITTFEYLLLGRPIEKLKNNITDLYEKIATLKDDKKLVIVTLNDPDDFDTHKYLYEKNFNKYNKVNILKL